MLRHIFNYFDYDQSNYITKAKFSFGMKNLGKSMTYREIENEFLIHEPSNKDQISFEEFRIIISEERYDDQANEDDDSPYITEIVSFTHNVMDI